MIGIIGGAFDPVHFGHLRPALELSEALGLQELRWVPTGLAPHRAPAQAAAGQRLAMLEAALAELEGSSLGWRIDERELKRDGPSYMVDTLNSLREELGREQPLCLLLGMDAFLALEGWHRWQELLGLCHLVVSHRPGWQLDDTPLSEGLGGLLQQHRVLEVEALSQQAAGSILFYAVTQLAISSSQIRTLIAEGRDAHFLLPRTVLQIIKAQQLYQS